MPREVARKVEPPAVKTLFAMFRIDASGRRPNSFWIMLLIFSMPSIPNLSAIFCFTFLSTKSISSFTVNYLFYYFNIAIAIASL